MILDDTIKNDGTIKNMVLIIPDINHCRRVAKSNHGELVLLNKLFKSLKKFSEENGNSKNFKNNYIIWYNIPIRNRYKEIKPDFLVLHPEKGILVLEVKGWSINSIHQVTSTNFTLQTEQGLITVSNPLAQARHHAEFIKELLQKDANLSPKGNLKFSYNYAVVFPHINKSDYISAKLIEVLPLEKVIFNDDIGKNISYINFEQKLSSLFYKKNCCNLTEDDIDRIRSIIYPEITIQLNLSIEDNKNKANNEEDGNEELQNKDNDISNNLIAIMDLQQEQLARSIKDGHRVIHGVAGSGKTLILLFRCEYLARQNLKKPILVLCFNIVLANQLRYILQQKGISLDWVNVRHFHGWCKEQLKIFKIPYQDNNLDSSIDTSNELDSFSKKHQKSRFSEIVEKVIIETEKGNIKGNRYSAILIDEVHDFEPEWLKLLVKMVDEESQNLLILYDDTQSIYKKKEKLGFSFKSVGIKAVGNTTILKVNYRNTEQISQLASQFLKETILKSKKKVDINENINENITNKNINENEEEPLMILPKKLGRRGSLPQLIPCSSIEEEIKVITKKILEYKQSNLEKNDLKQNNTKNEQIAVLCPTHTICRKVYDYFQKNNINSEYLGRDFESKFFKYNQATIKIMTIHSSKGLEFSLVCIAGIGTLPHSPDTLEADARLLFVGITRAMNHLVLTYSSNSILTQKLEKLINLLS